MAYVTKPSLVFPPYLVRTPEILQEMEASVLQETEASGKGPYLERVRGFELGVEERYFVAPLEVIAKPGTMEERNDIALTGMNRLAIQAADSALTQAGLAATDIDCIITSNSTTPKIPGLDVYLVNTLGLRPDVLRMPFTTLGCVGGAHTLSIAIQLADARPGMRALIVVGEALSAVYQPGDNSLTGLMYRQLFGDSAGACVVSSDPRGACLETHGSWQTVVPDTMNTYRLVSAANGQHFLSDYKAQKAITKLTPPLKQWLDDRAPGWTVHNIVGHPGGPAVLRYLAEGLGFPDDPDGLLVHAWDSLRRYGNLGGTSVLHILGMTADAPPHPDPETLIVAMGPGLSGAAVLGTLHPTGQAHQPG
ncbi:PhlD [Streptomyces sp. NPDC057654]|uniref:PhlD n=1 Tax=Streptomyces sp. NPDC057654 TaxID=3346196 RepID=UPI003678EC06